MMIIIINIFFVWDRSNHVQPCKTWVCSSWYYRKKKYLSWILDAEIHLDAMGLGDTIKEKSKASDQDKTKATEAIMRFSASVLHGLKP